MPRTSWALILLAAACSRRTLPPALGPAPIDPVRRPIFAGRALATPQERERILKVSPVLNNGAYDREIEKIYTSIDPEKSLFIRDVTGVCRLLPCSFNHWLDRASRIVNPNDVNTVRDQWLRSARASLGATLPQQLELKAIVNRLDLAAPNGPDAPEFRLIFADPQLSVKFRLIFEFALPGPAADYAAQWKRLSDPDISFPEELTRLIGWLEGLSLTRARIRVNSAVPGGVDSWRLLQWDFTLGNSPTQPSRLTDQMRDDCLYPGVLSSGCAGYVRRWNDFPRDDPHATPPDYWPLQNTGALSAETIYLAGRTTRPRTTMPIPERLQHASGNARDTISLEQCSFCHGGETDTEFTHIDAPPQAGDPIRLSCFLAGKDGGRALPAFRDYDSRNPSILCEARSQFAAPTAHVSWLNVDVSDQFSGSPKETRFFHDLGRRASAMASLLVPYDPSRKMDANKFAAFKSLLVRSYSTGMTH